MKRFDKILTDIQEVLLPLKTHSDTIENETPETELMEYKKDFLDMNIGSLRAIMKHAQSILEAVETNDSTTKENLTESWLQGKIAITEDYMRTIHDFVKYVPSDDDKSVAGCGCGGNKKKAGNTQPKVNETKTQNVPQPTTQPNIHQAKPTDK
jgi:hypothetical protein